MLTNPIRAPRRRLAALGLATAAALGGAPTLRAQEIQLHVVPNVPRASDRITFVVEGAACPGAVEITRSGDRILVEAFSTAVLPTCGPLETTLAPLPEGEYSVELRWEGDVVGQRALRVAAPLDTLSVAPALAPAADGVYEVTVDWSLSGEPAQRAFVVPIGGAGADAALVEDLPVGGYFWFFSPENPELTFKMLDGRALTGGYWIFLSSTTTLPFEVRVRKAPGTPDGGREVWRHEHPGGLAQPVVDLEVDPGA
jgi:hypothetical protein